MSRAFVFSGITLLFSSFCLVSSSFLDSEYSNDYQNEVGYYEPYYENPLEEDLQIEARTSSAAKNVTGNLLNGLTLFTTPQSTITFLFNVTVGVSVFFARTIITDDLLLYSHS